MSTLDWVVIVLLVDVPLLAALTVAWRRARRDGLRSTAHEVSGGRSRW